MLKIFMVYEVNPTTWFYLSLLMIVGIFFKFRRVWSIRNLDLGMLSLLSPGLLLVSYGFCNSGYPAILAVSFLLMFRMLCDPLMVRRPLLDVNLSRGGLIFSCVALSVFLVASTFLTNWRNPITPQMANMQQLLTTQLNERILEYEQKRLELPEAEREQLAPPQLAHGPGMPFFTQFADQSRLFLLEEMRRDQLLQLASVEPGETMLEADRDEIAAPKRPPVRIYRATQLVVILSQLAIIVGILMIGWIHFENFGTGIAAATLYLLLPYSAQIPTQMDHLVPAAFLIWAVFAYRLPSLAGVLIGIASALVFFPAALIPLWIAFYWSRGRYRFLITSLGTLLVIMMLAISLSGGLEAFGSQLRNMFGLVGSGLQSADGLWNLDAHRTLLRIPVVVLYVLMVFALAFWPAQKNLGTLLSSSAALMVGAQFCLPFQGGLYMAWFLPMMILVVMRPNLEDRIAIRAIAKKSR